MNEDQNKYLNSIVKLVHHTKSIQPEAFNATVVLSHLRNNYDFSLNQDDAYKVLHPLREYPISRQFLENVNWNGLFQLISDYKSLTSESPTAFETMVNKCTESIEDDSAEIKESFLREVMNGQWFDLLPNQSKKIIRLILQGEENSKTTLNEEVINNLIRQTKFSNGKAYWDLLYEFWKVRIDRLSRWNKLKEDQEHDDSTKGITKAANLLGFNESYTFFKEQILEAIKFGINDSLINILKVWYYNFHEDVLHYFLGAIESEKDVRSALLKDNGLIKLTLLFTKWTDKKITENRATVFTRYLDNIISLVGVDKITQDEIDRICSLLIKIHNKFKNTFDDPELEPLKSNFLSAASAVLGSTPTELTQELLQEIIGEPFIEDFASTRARDLVPLIKVHHDHLTLDSRIELFSSITFLFLGFKNLDIPIEVYENAFELFKVILNEDIHDMSGTYSNYVQAPEDFMLQDNILSKFDFSFINVLNQFLSTYEKVLDPEVLNKNIEFYNEKVETGDPDAQLTSLAYERLLELKGSEWIGNNISALTLSALSTNAQLSPLNRVATLQIYLSGDQNNIDFENLLERMRDFRVRLLDDVITEEEPEFLINSLSSYLDSELHSSGTLDNLLWVFRKILWEVSTCEELICKIIINRISKEVDYTGPDRLNRVHLLLKFMRDYIKTIPNKNLSHDLIKGLRKVKRTFGSRHIQSIVRNISKIYNLDM